MKRIVSLSPQPTKFNNNIVVNYQKYYPISQSNPKLKTIPFKTVIYNNSSPNSLKKSDVVIKKNEKSEKEINEKKQNYEQLKMQFILLSSEIERISRAYVQKEKEFEYYFEAAKKLEKNVSEKNNEILQNKEIIKDLSKELEFLINKDKEKKNSLTKIVEENPQLEKCYKDIEELENKLNILKEDFNNEKELANFWKNNCEMLEKKINEFVFENARLGEYVKELKNENNYNDYEQLYNESKITIDDYQNENKSLKNQISELQKELNLTQKELNYSQKELAITKEKSEISLKKIFDLENEVNLLRNELKNSAKIQEENKILKENLENLKKQYEIISVQKEELKENELRMLTEIDNLQIRYNNLEISHKKHIEELKTILKKNEKENELEILNLKKKIQSFEKEISNSNEHLERIVKENKILKNNERELKIKINEFEQIDLDMKTRIGWFESEKKSLEKKLEIEKKNGILLEKKNSLWSSSAKKRNDEELGNLKNDLEIRIVLLASENTRLHGIVNDQIRENERLETKYQELSKSMEHEKNLNSYSSQQMKYYSEKKFNETNTYYNKFQNTTNLNTDQSNYIIKLQEEILKYKKNIMELNTENEKLRKYLKIVENTNIYAKELEERINYLIDENNKLKVVIMNRYKETLSWKP